MEQIPQEIYDRIATQLGDTEKRPGQHIPHAERAFNRPVLATISRKWQRAIERRSFRALELRSTELHEFESIMTNARRRYLRVLRYYTVLPVYPAGSRQLFERHGDRTANDEAFSAAIHHLFRIFKDWEDQSSDRPGYSVQLHIRNLYSPTDHRFRGRSYEPTEEAQQCQYGEFGMRCRYSYIRLLNPTELPIVSGIEIFELHWRNPYSRKLAPQTFVEIAAKLPNLRKIWGELADSESAYPALRRRYRNDLVYAIESLSFPASIKHLSLTLQHWGHMDQAWQPTSLLHPGASHDSLSGTVWRATCHQNILNTLYIKGVVDTSLLWPGSVGQIPAPDPKSPVLVKPFWQNLKSLTIHFHITSPSGDWYFHAPRNGPGSVFDSSVASKAESDIAMPPGYGSSEKQDSDASLRYSFVDELWNSGNAIARVFRLVPNEPVLVPLIESFARACLQIPNLENATLATELREPIEIDSETHHFPSEWGIYFAAPANRSGYPVYEEYSYPGEDLTVPRLTFNTRKWRLDEDLRILLRGIGGYMDRLDEKYLDLWETVEKQPNAERRRRAMQAVTLQT
ncbi:hypothetical protein N431DRAFT_560164 [Stipitochalara longipes BDJ]|nr:hypothetical protein N431DRAFT_560164 [Stipitochalara longipes BDJ]